MAKGAGNQKRKAPPPVPGKKRNVWVIIAALALGLVIIAGLVMAYKGANSSKQETAKQTEIKRGVKPVADTEVVVLETENFGNIVIELYPNIAPEMVARFKQLTHDGFYDGTTFHRIDPQLGIIQGGDRLSKDDDPTNDGTGSSDLSDVPAEFSDIPYMRGTVGAARGQDNDSANSQFFVTLKNQPSFNERYTVFGHVIDGIGNAAIIMGAPTAVRSSRPSEAIRVKRAYLHPRSNYPATPSAS